jgi:hypothetical protein
LLNLAGRLRGFQGLRGTLGFLYLRYGVTGLVALRMAPPGQSRKEQRQDDGCG